MKMKLMVADNGVGIGDSGVSDSPGGDDYLRIGEMAKAFDVTLRTLRFYEDKGLISPRREGSLRLYSRRDRARLTLILRGRKIGFSLRDVKQMMDLYDPAGSNAKQLRLTLDKSEKQMARLNKQRAAIDEAIDELSSLMDSVRALMAERTLSASNANTRQAATRQR